MGIPTCGRPYIVQVRIRPKAYSEAGQSAVRSGAVYTHISARVRIRVQNLETKLVLTRVGTWTSDSADAAVFTEPMDAIAFCIRSHTRKVRLVGRNAAGADVYLYPFGGDPAVRAELKKLRKSIRESRRLKFERRVIRARLDAFAAGGKERRKQFPFKRKQVEDVDEDSNSTPRRNYKTFAASRPFALVERAR
jgi:hypothetical protein